VTTSLAVRVTRDEDGVYVAECPEIPGCVSQGESEEAARRNLEQAIRACLAVRFKEGIPPSSVAPSLLERLWDNPEDSNYDEE